MFTIKILRVLIVAVISICFLFAFIFLTACIETEPIEKVVEEKIKEEIAEVEIEENIREELEEPEEATTDEPLSACYNSYFPIKENMIWNYEMQTPEIESFKYSLSFKDIKDDSFIQIVTIPGGTIESNWSCSELGILQTEYRNLSFTDSSLGQIEHETTGVEGITFPPEDELDIGKTWKVIYDTKAKIKTGDIETSATVKIETEYEIISIEDVEVPAGNYPDALNIANNVTISISSDFFNTTFSPDSNSWFAKDVGLVKNVAELEDILTITELLSVE